MPNQLHLDPLHYASKWPLPTNENASFNNLNVVNQAGIDYAMLPNGLAKEAKLLELTKYFHGYIWKYTDLIVNGHLPQMHYHNKDTRYFLTYFLPKGTQSSNASFAKVAKHLHLAFPQQSATDVYDILNIQLLRAFNKYDPCYAKKVHKIIKAIKKLLKGKYFTIDAVSKKVKFDASSGIRVLSRNGFIKAVRDSKKKLLGYQITKVWPPTDSFLNAGPIGCVYFVQMWFRYYLQNYIDEQMKTLEARANEKMLQLEHRTGPDNSEIDPLQNLPSIEGELVDATGNSWAADMGLVKKPLDISAITPAWVQGNSDALFKNMTLVERQLIYFIYVQEMSWKQIADILGLSINQVQKIHNEILTFLKGKFGVKSAAILFK